MKRHENLPFVLSRPPRTPVIGGTARLASAAALALLCACGGGGGSGGGGAAIVYAFPDLRVGFVVSPVAPTVAIVPTAFSVTAGELPPGLELDPVTGEISGRPLAPAMAQAVTIEATDGTNTVSAALAISVSPPPASRFAVATNMGDDTLSLLSLDASSGFLRHEAFLPTGSSPRAVALAPDGSFVYTANGGSDDVSAFELDTATGELSPVSGAPFASSVEPIDVAVDPLLRFAYVLCRAGGASVIHGYTVAADGSLAPLAPATIAAGADAERLIVEPLGRFAYVTFGGAVGMVASFAIDPMTGALTAGTAALTGDTPRGLAARSDGAFLYVGNAGSSDVSVYSIVTGAPTQVGATVALTGGTSPEDVAVSADGGVLLVALASGALESFAIAAGGTLGSSGSHAVLGAARVAVDHGAEFVYALDPGANELALLTVAGNGALGGQTVERTRLRASPSDVAMVPGLAAVAYRTRFLYAGNVGSGDVHGFAVSANGSLAPLATPTVATGAMPNWTEVHPRSPAMYSVNASGFADAIEVFSLDAAGIPTSAQSVVQAGTTAWSLHFDPSGRFGFGVNTSLGDVFPYTVAANGTLAANGAPVTIGPLSSPGAGVVDPTGRFLYITRSNDDLVHAFEIDPVAGTIADLANPTAGASDGPLAVAVDATGRFAYAACFGAANSISAYAIDGATGELAELASSPFLAAGDPIDLVASPDGRRLYVSNRGTPSVQTFTIDVDSANATEDGALASANVRPLTDDPFKIRLDRRGGVLYVTHAATSGAVETFALDANGIPGPIDLDAAGDTTQGLAVLTELE